MVYSAKERAVRAADLTALSGGAVYGNGLQLVRLTNAILLGFAVVDLVVIAASRGLTEGITQVDPHFRDIVQKTQDVLFGLSYPTGAYPFLIFSEGLSLASDNQLVNNWPSLGGLSWRVPIPPSPIFLFNFETSGLPNALIPNMALKFRTANFFLTDINKPAQPKNRYHLKQSKTGEVFHFTQDEVEIAPNSKNPGQMRVKAGDFKGKYVSLAKDVETEVEKDAEKKLKDNTLMKVKTIAGGGLDLFNGIKLDVTDRDDPPDHTFLVYSSYTVPVKSAGNGSTDLQAMSEVSLEGDGLAAWDLNAPPYRTQLIPIGAEKIADFVNIQAKVAAFASSGLPSVSNMFDMAPKP